MEGRGNAAEEGLTGIWSAVMLIGPTTAVISNTSPPTCCHIPHLPFCHHSPISFTLGEAPTERCADVGAPSTCCPPLHFCQSQCIISSISLPLHHPLHVCLFTQRGFGSKDQMELTCLRCRLRHPTVSVTHNLAPPPRLTLPLIFPL